MNFGITIKHDRKNIRLLVEKISETNTQEKYKVIGKNQSFVLQNNRPLLIAKGLKTAFIVLLRLFFMPIT
jgi:hypothetical protein